MTLDDAIIKATGGPSVNEGLLKYYRANGATSNNLMDAERQYLLTRLAVADDGKTTNQDLWRAFLLAAPQVSLNDAQLAFWSLVTP